MKKWQCTVCGYVHEGEEPPDECPVCGADKSLFVLMDEAGSGDTGSSPAPKPSLDAESSKKWRCTVCGYVHRGSEPPETCPVCGADRSQFVQVDDTVTPDAPEPPAETAPQKEDPPAAQKSTQTESASQESPMDTFKRKIAASKYTQMLTRWHAHPIAVHVPNGVLPMSVLFTLLAALFSSSSLAIAAQYNIGFVAISMPLVIGTGVVDWINGFKGRMTHVFRVKMVCAGIITLLSFMLTVWGIVQPEVYTAALSTSWFFLLLHLVNLAAASVAGWYGGKLVFRK